MQLWKISFRFFLKIQGQWPTRQDTYYLLFLWEMLWCLSIFPTWHSLFRAQCHWLATTVLLGAASGDGMASHLSRCGAKRSLDVVAAGHGDAVTPQAGSAGAGARTSLEEGRFPVLPALSLSYRSRPCRNPEVWHEQSLGNAVFLPCSEAKTSCKVY